MTIIIRILLGLVVLCVASYMDVKTRRVSNNLWYILGGLSIMFLAVDMLNVFDIVKLIFVLSFLFLFYVMFQFNLFGGADAKALMCVSLLVPLSVLSIFFISLCFTVCVVPLVYLYYRKCRSFSEIIKGYPFPFMVSICFGFGFVMFTGFDILSLH